MVRHEREHITESTLLSEEKKAVALATVAANEEGFQSLFDEAAHEALVAAGKRRMSFKAMQVSSFATQFFFPLRR